MVELYLEEILDIPIGVTVTLDSRAIVVTGKHGTVKKSFKHLPLDIEILDDKKIRISMWNADTKMKSCVQTLSSHIENLFKGVMYKFQYKMRLVYSHFPININIVEDTNVVEIRHFLGEKRTRIVNLIPGVKCVKSEVVKDELILTGINLEDVSRSCALIRQKALVRKKDIRQFLDGIYVSEKGLLETVEA